MTKLQFLDILKNNKEELNEISIFLNLNINTIKRWIDRQNIPNNYLYLINKYLKNKQKEQIKEELTTKNPLDQYYTKPLIAKELINTTDSFFKSFGCNIFKDFYFIDASCGNGVFLDNFLTKNKIGIDIDPLNKQNKDNVLIMDYLDFNANKDIEDNKQNLPYFVFSNVPFGLRGHLALLFLKHSLKFADVVCFILPPLFNSTGKGSPSKRIQGYRLVKSQTLPTNAFIYPNNKEVNVNTIFNIYVKENSEILNLNNIPTLKIKNVDADLKKDVGVFSVSNGKSSSQKRNVDLINKCDFYLNSTIFNQKDTKKVFKFEDLKYQRGYGIIIKKQDANFKKQILAIDFSKYYFLGTNNSYNIRTNNIYEAIEELTQKEKGK